MKFMFAVNGLKWLLSLGMLAPTPSLFLTRADEPAASASSVGQAAANNAIVPVAWLEKDSYDWN